MVVIAVVKMISMVIIIELQKGYAVMILLFMIHTQLEQLDPNMLLLERKHLLNLFLNGCRPCIFDKL